LKKIDIKREIIVEVWAVFDRRHVSLKLFFFKEKGARLDFEFHRREVFGKHTSLGHKHFLVKWAFSNHQYNCESMIKLHKVPLL